MVFNEIIFFSQTIDCNSRFSWNFFHICDFERHDLYSVRSRFFIFYINKFNFWKLIYFLNTFFTFIFCRKQVNQKEWDLMKKWPKNYGFLSGEFLKKVWTYSYKKETQKTNRLNKCYSSFPFQKLEEESQAKNINPKHLNKQEDFPIVEPTDLSPVPVTSSAFVGWRCSDKLNVEFIDTKYHSPKHTIELPLQEGEFRIRHQHFIYLGWMRQWNKVFINFKILSRQQSMFLF